LRELLEQKVVVIAQGRPLRFARVATRIVLNASVVRSFDIISSIGSVAASRRGQMQQVTIVQIGGPKKMMDILRCPDDLLSMASADVKPASGLMEGKR